MKRFSRLIKWAFSGDRSPARIDAEKLAGWVEGEAPLYTEWNEVEYNRDRLINDNALRADLKGPMPPNVTRQRLCAGLMDASDHWYRPDYGHQFYEHAAAIVGSCLGWEWQTSETIYDKPVIFIVDSNSQVRKISNLWNAGETMTVSSALGLTFPYTSSHIFDICSDASYLYVLWERSSTGQPYVSRYSLTSSLGLVLTPDLSTAVDNSVGVWTSLEDSGSRIICADDDNLGIMLEYTNGPAVSIMAKDGTAQDYGIGNMGGLGGGGNYELLSLYTDETRVYWLNRERPGSDDLTYLNSALISDPTTSDLTRKLIATTAATSPNLAPRSILVLPGALALTDNTGRIWQYIPSTDAVDSLLTIDNRGTWPYTVSDYYGTALGTDGTSLWLQKPESAAGPTESMSLHKIPLGVLGLYSSNPTDFATIYGSRIDVGVPNMTAGYSSGKFLSDGRSMFFVSRGGFVLRIANPQGR